MSVFLAVLRKELRVELRTREVIYTSVFFALLLATTFMFSFFQGSETQWQVGPGILWIGLIFVATIAFGRTFERERRDGSIAALRLVPGVHSPLLWGKVCANGIMLLGVEIVLVPAVAMFFRMPLDEIGPGLALLLLLATWGLSALGTVLGAALVGFRMREVLLPLVLFPLIVPLLVGAVSATEAMMREKPEEFWDWTHLMIAFDAIYTVVASWLFRSVIESAE